MHQSMTSRTQPALRNQVSLKFFHYLNSLEIFSVWDLGSMIWNRAGKSPSLYSCPVEVSWQSDRSSQNFWLKLPLHKKHPLSHFLAQSKTFPVAVQQKKSLVHFTLPPTAALLIGISSYGVFLSGWSMRSNGICNQVDYMCLNCEEYPPSIVKWVLRGR